MTDRTNSRSARGLGAHQTLRMSSSLRTLSTTPLTLHTRCCPCPPSAPSSLSRSSRAPTSAQTTSSQTRSATPLRRRRTQRPPPALAGSSHAGATGARKMLRSEIRCEAACGGAGERGAKRAWVDERDDGRSEGGVRCARNGCSDSTCFFRVSILRKPCEKTGTHAGEEAEPDDARLPLLAALRLLGE